MSRILTVSWEKSLRSTALFDRFEARDAAGEPLYELLLLQDCFSVFWEGICRRVSLEIARYDWREDYQNDFLTFSAFRSRIAGRRFSPTDDLPPLVSRIPFGKGGEHVFSPAILLFAQSSVHRTGFGRQGRRYGQTGRYLILRAFLRSE